MRVRTYLMVACLSGLSVASGTVNPATNTAMKLATKQSRELAADARLDAVQSGFIAFKRTTYKEPFPGGVYIVNGDTPIGSEEELKEFYDKEIVSEWKSAQFGIELSNMAPALIADAPQGKMAVWDNVSKRALTYCVSSAFGARHQAVVDAMRSATQAWEAASDVKYEYIDNLDGACSADTNGVVFDVRPVDVSGTYLARAFFPRSPRGERNVLIDESAFNLKPGNLTLVGILRHELGHTLSFRHEQTRPEAGKCFEDSDWVPLTDYDAFSVMHYPQCNGLGDWSLTLTAKDKTGVACLYGPAQGIQFDAAVCRRE